MLKNPSEAVGSYDPHEVNEQLKKWIPEKVGEMEQRKIQIGT